MVPLTARIGPNERDDPAAMLNGCRQYLLMVANEVIGPELRAKCAASDLVQETFLEAQRHLRIFSRYEHG